MDQWFKRKLHIKFLKWSFFLVHPLILNEPHLASSHVGTFKVGVKKNVEVEGGILARIVDPDIEMELLLPEDHSVGDSEVVLPHR